MTINLSAWEWKKEANNKIPLLLFARVPALYFEDNKIKNSEERKKRGQRER